MEVVVWRGGMAGWAAMEAVERLIIILRREDRRVGRRRRRLRRG